jgi:hypothetical protein
VKALVERRGYGLTLAPWRRARGGSEGGRRKIGTVRWPGFVIDTRHKLPGRTAAGGIGADAGLPGRLHTDAVPWWPMPQKYVQCQQRIGAPVGVE